MIGWEERVRVTWHCNIRLSWAGLAWHPSPWMTGPHIGWISLLFISGVAAGHQSHGCTQASRRQWGSESPGHHAHLPLTLELRQLSPPPHYHLLLGLRRRADQSFCFQGPGDSRAHISHTTRVSPKVPASLSVLDHILKWVFPWGQLFHLFRRWWELANEKWLGIVRTAGLQGNVGSGDGRRSCNLAPPLILS